MAGEVKATTADILGLVEAMKELGLITKYTEKDGGHLEKGMYKLKKAYNKNPYVKAGRAMKGYFKTFKQLGEYTVKARSAGDEKLEAMEEEMTGLTKLTATMLFHTGIAKMMNKIGGKTNNMFAKMLMSIFSLVTIFAMVAFAFGIVMLAFQGADSPILDLTDGVWGIDEAAKGLIMALTGEGEGGLYGALTVVAAAATVGFVAFMLLGGPMAAVMFAGVLIVGTFHLVNKQFDNVYVAMAAATTVALLLAAAFIWLGTMSSSAAIASAAAWMMAFAPILLGIALIMGGLTILFLFATGKISGWLGWLLAAVAAVAVAIGLAILFPILAPFVAIIAIILFVAALVYRYWDEIVYYGKLFVDGIIAFGGWVLGWIGAIIGGIVAFVASLVVSVVGVGLLFVSTIIGLVLLPFVFVGKLWNNLLQSWTDSGKKKWRGFLSWLTGIGPLVKRTAIDAAKSVFNAIVGVYNSFASGMSFTIPDWVPHIGGEGFELPQIAALAKGGIVNKPTFALIGEDGPEAVIPLSQRNNPKGIGLGGNENNSNNMGPVTININVGGVTDRSDKRALAREIGDAIRDEMFRSGRSMGTRRGAL